MAALEHKRQAAAAAHEHFKEVAYIEVRVRESVGDADEKELVEVNVAVNKLRPGRAFIATMDNLKRHAERSRAHAAERIKKGDEVRAFLVAQGLEEGADFVVNVPGHAEEEEEQK
eukprot:TRINITY_DN5903_c0_g1_i1.p1 TRINITY_DN5903_c0_g1~~TRINITY_DN5903_c0_g1_i1.p1  ORF type:complete len:115 (+),score=46.37 TRINITY_DN5903_c0_g1_i1:202-546(+)